MAFPALPFTLPWKWIGVAAGGLIIVSAVFFSIQAYGSARYDAGVTDERIVWEQVVAEQALKLETLQRRADQFLDQQRSADKKAVEDARKELENAIEDIPDQPTSDRQRATACVWLRRQGKAPASCADLAAQ